MVFDVGTRSVVTVPDNTIPKKWDAYSGRDYTGQNISDVYNINEIGKSYHNKHTKNRCVQHSILGKCKKTVDDGKFSSGKVPLGAWADIYDGNCFTGTVTNRLMAPFKKLDDSAATNCAGGSSDMQNENLPEDCYTGTTKANNENGENCFASGINYPTFCQLGDYVDTVQACKDQCKGSNSLDNANNYCNFALDRLCGKKKGDPIKRNASGKQVIDSQQDWITSNICKSYCGGPNEVSSVTCKKHKQSYCSDPLSWPNAYEYCSDFWRSNPNLINWQNMNPACYNKITDATGPENVSTNNGCGKLCQGEGLDIDNDWCNNMRRDFCWKDENTFTNYCYRFCKDEPDLCAPILSFKCKDYKDRMDETIGDTGLKYHNFCSCFFDAEFYDNYKNKVYESIRDRGFEVLISQDNIDLSKPHCFYPTCNQNAVMTEFQRNDICSDDVNNNCLSNVLKNYSNLTDTDLKKCDALLPPVNQQIEPASTIPLPMSSTLPPPITSLEIGRAHV